MKADVKPLPTISIVGSPAPNKVLDVIRQQSLVADDGQFPRILISSAADYLVANNREDTDRFLREGTAILLLDAQESDKSQLVSHIGFGPPQDSTAYFISSRPAQNDRLSYLIHDLPVEDESGGYVVASSGKDGSAEELAVPANVEAIDESTAEEAFVLQILEALNAPLVQAVAVTTQPEQQKWIYNKTLNWSSGPGGTNHGITPQAQSTYISVTFTFYVYLDEQASGNFQWLYLEVLGYQGVGSSGMNRNDKDQRGWANGYIDIVVPAPANFSVNTTSPNNVNGSTSYTSSVSFNVGVDASVSGSGPSGGGSAGVTVSHSQTENITDWAIEQNDLNNWTFYQNNPWQATSDSFSDDMMTGTFDWDVAGLPGLSTGVMNFSTMSVWNNQSVSTEIITVDIEMSARWTYIGIDGGMIDTGIYWRSTHGTSTFPFQIDLGLVS